ncbi:phage tail protein [Allosphingosinicella sp.]|uniref:phage tail protein n=1 Tax=Allosphingosinicella sp. TaxID=2823234 RepID=UPI003783D2F4
MSSPFVAEIKILGCNFAPTGHAFCFGQLLPISQNTALFSLLGTTYGGDGKSTFALPNLQGAVPIQQGQGPGLQLWDLGEQQGSDFVTLIQSEIPAHNHSLQARNDDPLTASPNGAVLAKGLYDDGSNAGAIGLYQTAAPNVQMNVQSASIAGGSLPHNNLMPYLALTYVIALQGVFPARP